MHGSLPPYILTSKVLRVENAEVVYHNVVTVPVEQESEAFFVRDPRADLPLRTALTRGVDQTIEDLRRAFQ
jgi:hypothetical protein